MTTITIAPPKNAIAIYPDSVRYKCGFGVKSQSSNSIYKISYDAAQNAKYWVCSCRGNIAHGQCKHLTAAGLKGRKFGKDLTTAKILGIL